MTQLRTYAIHLDGIRFRGRHGASRAERDLPQDFVATLDVELPIEALPRSDHRKGVVDYGALAELIVHEGTSQSYRLLETLAARLIDRILEETPSTSVRVRIKKFGPPTPVSVDSAAIELFGTRT
jgi:7,8-dihydroneopterin aldolase/epimerase/oxygenase